MTHKLCNGHFWFADGTVCVAPLSIAVARALFLIGWTSDSQTEMRRALELLGWARVPHGWTWWPVPVRHVKRAMEVVNHQNNLLKPLGVTYLPNYVRRLDRVFMVSCTEHNFLSVLHSPESTTRTMIGNRLSQWSRRSVFSVNRTLTR